MWISRYICLFMIYSFMGWVFECVYCVIKEGRWENRGFLFGPACPIYGTGAVAISVLDGRAQSLGFTLQAWQIFLIAVLGSAILEYLTSWTLEKLFHAIWWDYSNLPLNLHGRISFFTSMGFGAAGILIVYVIAPYTENVMSRLTPIGAEFLALCAISIFVADLTLTVTLLLHFDRLVIRIEDTFNKNMDALVKTTVEKSNTIKQGITARQKAMYDRLNTMNRFVRTTVGRIHTFRYTDQDKAETTNGWLSLIKKYKK